MTKISENHIALLAIKCLEDLGYQYIYGPDIAPDGFTPERESYGDDKNSLVIRYENFNRDFLLKVFSYFSKNEELGDGFSELYVYNRIKNRIIRKKYENVGLSEFCIDQPILSNQFYNLMKEKLGN